MKDTIQHLKDIAPSPTKNNVTDNIITKEDATMNNTTSTATTNNTTNAKETTTMNREISTGAKTEGQFTIDYQRNGYGAIIPIIDGVEHPELMMGYVSDADAQAGLKLLEEALKATNGNIPQAMRYMYTAAQVAANDIHPTEVLDVDGYEFTIDYEKRAAYLGAEEITNLDDLPNAVNYPREVVKDLLLTKVRARIEEYQEAEE